MTLLAHKAGNEGDEVAAALYDIGQRTQKILLLVILDI